MEKLARDKYNNVLWKFANYNCKIRPQVIYKSIFNEICNRCDKCSKRFWSTDTLELHVSRIHTDQDDSTAVPAPQADAYKESSVQNHPDNKVVRSNTAEHEISPIAEYLSGPVKVKPGINVIKLFFHPVLLLWQNKLGCFSHVLHFGSKARSGQAD